MTQFRPSRFEILPTVVKNIIIICCIVFLAQNTIDNKYNINLEKWLALHTLQSTWFKPWQLITHMFMHGSFQHLFFNMFALWMFGSILENLWGQKRFLIFYFSCGLGAALAHLVFLYFEMQHIVAAFKQISFAEQETLIDSPNFILNQATLGASGAVFGCLAAFAYLFPNTELQVYFIIPIKAKWIVLIYAAIELYLSIKASPTDSVAHIAHLGGALIGFILVYYWNKSNKKHFY